MFTRFGGHHRETPAPAKNAESWIRSLSSCAQARRADPFCRQGYSWTLFATLILGSLALLPANGCGSDGRTDVVSGADQEVQPQPDVFTDTREPADSHADSIGPDSSLFDPAAVQIPYCKVDEQQVEAIYQGLSVRQRIGQHLSMHILRKGTSVDPVSEQKMRDLLPGAVSVAQITGVAEHAPETTARFLHHAQLLAAELSGVPLFISSDQEGGVYTSVNHMTGGTDSIGPTAIGATRDPWVAFDQFDMMGREVKAMGINTNFGPLLDTHYHKDNGNLNTRTFGPDVELNTKLGLAASSGFRHNLVLAMAKHFPGDGMTGGNTHHTFIVNGASREELENKLLKPFRAAFEGGIDAVMMMPAQFTALDDKRAAITSRPIITGILRGEMGFQGLVFSDDLSMYGARLGLSPEQSQGVEAIKAGTDILLTGGEDLLVLVDRIEQELASGGILEEEFAESTKRILRHKQKYCLFQQPTYPDEKDIETVAARVARPEDAAMTLQHAVRAVALLVDDGVLPLTGKRVLCVGPSVLLADPAAGWNWFLESSFCSALQAVDPSVSKLDYVVGGGEAAARNFLQNHLDQADVVVVATFHSFFSQPQQELLEWILANSDLPVVHVPQGVVFDALQSLDRASAVLALQGSLPVMFQAAAQVLYGRATAGGQVLYDLTNP